MIEFYIRIVDFSQFKHGEPVRWTQAITDVSSWSDWHPKDLVKLRMDIDEVDFVQTDNTKEGKYTIKKIKPLKLTLREGEITKV